MGGRGERGEEAGGERDGGGLVVVAAAVVFFLSSTFLLASAAWSSSRLREIDSHGADHFRGVAQMVLAARFVGVNKTSCHFCPTKKSAGGLDKRGNLAYNHGILLLRSAPLLILLILLIVLTRLPLSGVWRRAVLPRRWFSCSRHPRQGHYGSPFSASTLSAMRFKLSRSLRSCRIRRSAFAVRYST